MPEPVKGRVLTRSTGTTAVTRYAIWEPPHDFQQVRDENDVLTGIWICVATHDGKDCDEHRETPHEV